MDKLQSISLDDLYYLGNRNYIQGGTIYELLLPRILHIFSAPTNLDFTYRSIIQKNLIFLNKQQEDKEIKIVMKLEDRDKKYKFYGYHKEDSPIIQERISYDEEEILKTAIINQNNIFLNHFIGKDISVVRYVIAMNKELLNTLFKDEIKDYKWFLSRLTLDKIINESEIQEIQLKYCSRFEFQIVKTEIFINQISVGFIYFSLKRNDYVS
ncbi:hypothetical protein LS70_003360 [Helicobacter sp. MIT 11-5569]|uniref:hypothetical protein n=1 Tax=Helicobacter sp. MIT 11-5569 TaxID=1548151 RepID=UPI00051F936B|nr:hypothetical protein [Helicobacter sp. MIT 11-5569]TLD84598.1 hypothetical protein LS70_003360 [Helicobacter sp. MIT 11-5569]